ncbi:hypothetical protein [Massilia sp. CFBP9026]|uniref:hypothetical protein n=1 Tax=Massilia sp. CFBP9026 TaxID=3096536 RepID=UPI002A69CED5|nr:hypothetical protein [Massilia sp. CFBP9026]MDY0963262.1 hypothetical protein [Massilia sp. CFBP9026]
MSSPYYVPSGRLPARAIVSTAACALLVMIPAWLYAWLTIHSPLVLLDWFAMCVFAVVMGVAARQVARQAKARNPVWVGRLGLAIGVAGWYAHWAAWLAIADAGSFASLLAAPHDMWRFGMLLAENEVRHVAGMRIEGSALVAGWIVEFILLTTLPRSLARGAAEEPFCELSGDWATPFELPRRFAWIEEPHVAVHRLETAPGELFSILGAGVEADAARYSAVTLFRTEGDPFVSIDNVQVERDAKKEKKTTRPVIAYLRLPGMDAERIIDECSAPTAMETGQAQADPPELVDAIDHLGAGRLEEALAGAMPHAAATQDGLRIHAIRLCAMASARLGRWAESQRYWHALCHEEPGAFNALQTGCCCAMTGDTARGEEWIAWARERNATSREMPDPQIVTSFISALTQSGQAARAMPYLEQMRALYTGLGCNDATTLFARRVPLFGTFLQNSLPIVCAVLGQEEGRAWYAAMLPHLDGPGNETLGAWLDENFANMASATPASA